MRRLLSLAAGIVAFALILPAADITGIWLGVPQRPAQPGAGLRLPVHSKGHHSDRQSLSGLRQHADPERHGRRRQDRFQVMAREQDGNEINESVFRFTGTMKDGEIEITREREELRNAGNSGASFSRAAKLTFKLKRLP